MSRELENTAKGVISVSLGNQEEDWANGIYHFVVEVERTDQASSRMLGSFFVLR